MGNVAGIIQLENVQLEHVSLFDHYRIQNGLVKLRIG